MVLKGLPSPVRQGNIDHPPVLLAPFPDHISLFHQAVHGDGQSTHGHRQLSGDGGHIFRRTGADGLDHMHVVIGDILEFRRNDGLFLYVHNVAEQAHQYLV